MNAKLLIELEGVEAGSKECDPCCEYMDYHSNEYGDSAECKLFRGRNLHLKADDCSPLRCPACLKAEEAASAHGITVTREWVEEKSCIPDAYSQDVAIENTIEILKAIGVTVQEEKP